VQVPDWAIDAVDGIAAPLWTMWLMLHAASVPQAAASVPMWLVSFTLGVATTFHLVWDLLVAAIGW
jgi:hypothetical protein